MKLNSFYWMSLTLLTIISTSCTKDETEDGERINAVCFGNGQDNYYSLSVGEYKKYDNDFSYLIKHQFLSDSGIYFKWIRTDHNKTRNSRYIGFSRIDRNGDLHNYGLDGFSILSLKANLFVGQEWEGGDPGQTLFTVLSLKDTVITPYCTYFNCLKIKADPQNLVFLGISTIWYAKGIGQVKSYYDPHTTHAGGPRTSYLKELHLNQ